VFDVRTLGGQPWPMDFTYDIQARAVGSGYRARWRSCLGWYEARTVPQT
jgi:hypothetical protein